MSNKTKGIIAAILAFAGAVFTWYCAYSDGNPATTPNTGAVISTGNDLVNSIKADDEKSTPAAVETKIAPE